MRIVNPLYDVAFKYLMENNDLARKIIGLILEEEIEELSVGQQETSYTDEKRFMTLYRLDFKAVIKQPDGTRQKVLIELQKSKSDTEIQRFRTYLGLNYLKPETEKQPDGKEAKVSYPIITIYILGYSIADIPYVAVTINNCATNSVNRQPIELRSDFVRMLTHRSHILQVGRLPEERRTRLEQFLSFFNQAWKTEEGFILDMKEVPEEFKELAHYLSIPLMDEAFQNRLRAEEEIDARFDQQEAKYLQQIEEAKRKEEEAVKSLAVLVRKMHAKGFSVREIAEDLGKATEEIEKLLRA
ncbi:MAG: hypothetical protein HC896_01825 [Bacteroidales bacterium]|nr:hypothetical protein [Bacteroidales bacterium]